MISVDLHNMRQFIPLPYEAALTPRLRLAHDHLRAGTGAGGEFTGWCACPNGMTGRSLNAFRRQRGGYRPILRLWWSSASAALT